MSGTCIETPRVRVTAELVASIVDTGGYVHPLFRTDGDPDGVPVPGQGVLLLAGGLVEQSGLLDDALALLEIRRATFDAMVRTGDEVWVGVRPRDHRRTRRGQAVQEFEWTVRSAPDRTVARADVVMLMANPVEDARS